MRKDWIFTGLLTAATLLLSPVFGEEQKPAEPLVPPEQIEKEIADAQKEFDEAKKMFNPWYTGPLLTPSASVLPAPHVVIQPYLFYINTYAHFDKHGKSHDTPNFQVVKPQLAPLQVGITQWMDSTLSFSGVYNQQKRPLFHGLGRYIDKRRIPTTRTNALSPRDQARHRREFPHRGITKVRDHERANISSTGAGSYETTFSLNISKVVWWLTLHPMNFRTSLQYAVNSNVHVKGFNTYGGGLGTNGSVKGGNTFTFDLGYEYSITQRCGSQPSMIIVQHTRQRIRSQGIQLHLLAGHSTTSSALPPLSSTTLTTTPGFSPALGSPHGGATPATFLPPGIFSFYYLW